MLKHSAVSAALADVLGAPDWIDSQKPVLVVSYRENFDGLWSMDPELCAWLASGNRTLVIAWEETPQRPGDPAGLGDYLTPVDWAVAARLLDAGGAAPAWRVLILDLASHQHPSSLAMHWFRRDRQVGAALAPWLGLLAPAQFDELLDTLERPAPWRTPEHAGNLIRKLWVDHLLSPERPEERHSLANVAAPRALLSAMGVSGVPPIPAQTAFDVLLSALGLMSAGRAQEPAPWCERCEWEPFVDRFVLIDDLHEFGWADFLSAALELHDSRELDVHANVDTAIEMTGDSIHLRCSGERPVLFLDLRLFSRSDPQLEGSFLSQLLEIARAYPLTRPGIPWPGFSPVELSAMESALADHDRRELGYLLALTLLPRLLALSDPALPIVLFSSTGRREIVEALAPYGNITLDFDKPRLSSTPESSAAAETRPGFVAAMRKATLLARVRAACRALALRARQAPSMAPSSSRFETETAEIYVSHAHSSNPAKFAVGGIGLLYPDTATVRRLDRALEPPLAWGLAENHAPVNGSDPLPEHFCSDAWPDLERQFALVDDLLRRHQIRVFGFALVVDRGLKAAPEPGADPFREDGLDALYRTMLGETLEAVIFDGILPRITGPASVSVDVATRTIAVSGAARREELRKRFGFGFTADGQRLYSLSAAGVFPIVSAALARRPNTSARITPQRARGVTLQDFELLSALLAEDRARYRRLVEQSEHPRPCQIHYLARAIPRLAVNIPFVSPTPLRWLQSGFFQRRNRRFADGLRAARAADREDWLNAVSALLPEEREQAAPGRLPAPSYEQRVSAQAPAWIVSLSGADLLELCRRLPSRLMSAQLRIFNLPTGWPAQELEIRARAALASITPIETIAFSSEAPFPFAEVVTTTKAGALRLLEAAQRGELRVGDRKLKIKPFVPVG